MGGHRQRARIFVTARYAVIRDDDRRIGLTLTQQKVYFYLPFVGGENGSRDVRVSISQRF